MAVRRTLEATAARLLGWLAIAVLLTAAAAVAGEFEEISVDNIAMKRTISGTSNILKTTKFLTNGVQMMDQPSVEFMIELDSQGETLMLAPIDFEIKSRGVVTKGTEKQTSVELKCTNPRLPITIYVDYWGDPRYPYMQKSISIPPCKDRSQCTIKRITLEDMPFGKGVTPISLAVDGFGSDAKGAFALVETKSGKGLCFDFPAGKIETGRGHSLTAYQVTDTPLTKGFETGRITLGAVGGSADKAYAAYRQMLLETRYPALAKDNRLGALKKKFSKAFGVCDYLPVEGGVEAEGRLAHGSGFILLFNTSDQSRSTIIPLSDPTLRLTGEQTLTDWSQLDAPEELGSRKVEDKVSIEVPAHGYKIIGINTKQ